MVWCKPNPVNLSIGGFVVYDCVRGCLSAPGPVLNPSDVFEQPQPAGPKKIEFHISVPEVAAILDGGGPGPAAGPDPDSAGRGPPQYHLESLSKDIPAVHKDHLAITLSQQV